MVAHASPPSEVALPPVPPPYASLYFGKSDSRNEANADPQAFRQTFVDLDGVADAIVAGERFLVLGPKGTGKSALAWYLDVTQGERHLATVRDASDLPLAEVPRLQTGQAPGPERTVVAWKFILLCNYLELLLKDPDCSLQGDKELVRVTRLLRDFGFMGDASGRALVKASTVTVEIPLPKLGTLYKRESKPTLNIYNLNPYLEQWAAKAESTVRHVLLIDGLDSIFLNDARYDESLSSLVQAAYSVNQKLRSRAASGSVVLLLRNDVFSRIALSLPDSQKMRDDLSCDLDWRVLSGSAGINAPLLRLVNAKASAAAGEDLKVLDYFPSDISVGGKEGYPAKRIPALQYFLNMTRHTPRDLLRLFEEIRKVEALGIYEVGRVPLPLDVIREGVLQYATKYFVGAIENEFAGYKGGPESAAAALTALKTLNKQTFNRDEFQRALDSLGKDLPLGAEDLLRLLFYAGAIGNSVGGGYKDKTYMQFYHRRDDAQIYLGGRFVLHHALIHAWGLRRTTTVAAAPSGREGRSQPSPAAKAVVRRSRTRTRRTGGGDGVNPAANAD